MTRDNLSGYQAAYLDQVEQVGPVPFDPSRREEVEDLARFGLLDLGTLASRRVRNRVARPRWALEKRSFGPGWWVAA
jgi:hypothetical protein